MEVELEYWQKRVNHQRKSFTDQSMQERNRRCLTAAQRILEAVHLFMHILKHFTFSRRMYKEPAYSELHTNVDHLGLDRTLHLTKDRFHWPKMEENIRCFVSSLCTCVNQMKPRLQAAVPQVPVASLSSTGSEGVDFLHLENYSNGF